ncbi:MAG: DUF421 domain-containing protein [Flavisolibacter sp.]
MIYLLEAFDWKQLLLGDEEWSFLWETLFRTSIMFIILLTGLRILGKRGVKQLSVFELVVIIGLGSAAGDPMFYKDVGILPAIIVFSLVIGLYKLITYLVGKSTIFEHVVEGKPVCLIQDGRFAITNFQKEALAQDEFFAELRMASIKHLGQVEKAYIETTGNLSIYYYPDDQVKYGLPILPEMFEEKMEEIKIEGIYSCRFCGHTRLILPAPTYSCPECKRKLWTKAINDRRII